ncbi:MAG: phosphatase PAP2 family protein [Pseudomonadota bacterium]
MEIKPWKWTALAGAIILSVLLDGPTVRGLAGWDGPGREVLIWGYWLGHGLVQSLGLIGAWVCGRRFQHVDLIRAGREGLVAFMVSGLGTQVLKRLVGRPRPRLSATHFWPVGPTLADGFDSFPSGHTATSMALALVLSWRFPRWAPFFFAVAAFTAATRILGGSHFPLDVWGGMALGLTVGWLVVSGKPIRAGDGGRGKIEA